MEQPRIPNTGQPDDVLLTPKRQEEEESYDLETLGKRKRNPKYTFSVDEETFMAQWLARPEIFLSLHREPFYERTSGAASGETCRLCTPLQSKTIHEMCRAELNRTFGRSLNVGQVANKLNNMRRVWENYHERQMKLTTTSCSASTSALASTSTSASASASASTSTSTFARNRPTDVDDDDYIDDDDGDDDDDGEYRSRRPGRRPTEPRCHFYDIMRPVWSQEPKTFLEASKPLGAQGSSSVPAMPNANLATDHNDRHTSHGIAHNCISPEAPMERTTIVIRQSNEPAIMTRTTPIPGQEAPSQEATSVPPQFIGPDVLEGIINNVQDTPAKPDDAESEKTGHEQSWVGKLVRIEKEATKREQLRAETRAKAELNAEKEATEREKLRIEAAVRIEEVRIREQELTKREAIRAEVEKIQGHIRLKEKEIEHAK
ncbi:hypothetical protein BGX31_011372, partial [Mortierella sp. GBA43]